jgi:hypothetical protein
LLGFTLGLVLDAFRWKEQPRLLFASVGGLLAAVYLGFYFFFQLDVVLNFNYSHYKVLPLLLPAIASLPLLVWYYDGRTISERPGLGLALLILAGCVGQHFVPGYTRDVPRSMNLVYREEVGQDGGQPSAWLTLDSDPGEPDRRFAGQQGFAPVSLPGFDGVQQEVLAKETAVLDLPDVVASRTSVVAAVGQGEHPRHVLDLAVPKDVRLLAFNFPVVSGLATATIDGQLAYDSSLANRHSPNGRSLAINHPRQGKVRLNSNSPAKFARGFDDGAVRSAGDAAVYRADWPVDAQPALQTRALKTWRLKLAAESPADP